MFFLVESNHMDTKDLKEKLDLSLKFFKEEIASIRGSRPTPALVEDILVDAYEQKTPIKHLGSISIVLPREIQVSVWDGNVIAAVAKAITAKLNIQTATDGNIIHANLPALTQERRDELIKIIKTKSEETKIKSRNIRDDFKKEVGAKEKEGEITEDERFKIMEEVQKEVDKFNQDLEDLLEKKIAEIND